MCQEMENKYKNYLKSQENSRYFRLIMSCRAPSIKLDELYVFEVFTL